MKWIVKRCFYRTPQLANLEIIDACKGANKTSPHPSHIHMGAIFELGAMQNETELADKKNRDPLKPLIAVLRYSGCIGNVTDEEVVARVEKDIADRNSQEANFAKMGKQADAAQFAALFQTLANLVQKQPAPAK